MQIIIAAKGQPSEVRDTHMLNNNPDVKRLNPWTSFNAKNLFIRTCFETLISKINFVFGVELKCSECQASLDRLALTLIRLIKYCHVPRSQRRKIWRISEDKCDRLECIKDIENDYHCRWSSNLQNSGWIWYRARKKVGVLWNVRLFGVSLRFKLDNFCNWTFKNRVGSHFDDFVSTTTFGFDQAKLHVGEQSKVASAS